MRAHARLETEAIMKMLEDHYLHGRRLQPDLERELRAALKLRLNHYNFQQFFERIDTLMQAFGL